MHTVNRNARIMLVLFIFFSCYYNFSDAKLSKLQNSLYICSTERLLTEQPVATFHLCAIVSADNPLSGMSTVSLQQLAKYKICTPARGMNARRMFDTLIHKHGVNLKPRMEINEIHTLLHLVKTGRWVAILVDSIIHGEDGLCAVPLREAALPMPVVWLYPKGMYMRKAIRAFMGML